jgi:UDP-glucose-4-epimerase GalE
LVEGDLADPAGLKAALSGARFDAAMHFAAFTYVGESVREPLRYYRNNVANTLSLLEALKEAGVGRLVFSSSCATYGTPVRVPMGEDTPQHPINPYGRTKLAVEWMLRDSAEAWGLGSCALRYFNACGAASDGTLGEDHDPETHLIPLVLQTALGQRPAISVFGTDYDTPDGTCIRDFVHVTDLAEAHLAALRRLEAGDASAAYNLGNGDGVSVRDVIQAVGRAVGRDVPYVIGARRPGDPARLVAASGRARRELGWTPRFDRLDDIVGTAWRWHDAHPGGYDPGADETD